MGFRRATGGADPTARPLALSITARRPLPVAVRHPGAIPVIAAGAAFLLFAVVLLGRDDRLLTQAYDQAFFEQLVWNAGHSGRLVSGFTPGNFLGLHFEPLLLLPALLELAWPDARLLTILNAVGLATTAPAGYLLARALLPQRAWLAAALSAPLPVWTAVQQAAIADFHPEALALPGAMLAAWAGLKGHTALMWILGLAVLTAKEDQAYTVAVVGLLVAASGRRRAGLALAGLGIGWGLVVVGVVMPILRGGGGSDVGSYYSWLPGATPARLAVALLHPSGWLAFGLLLLSLAGLPFLRPRWALLALPPLLADLLSAHASQADLRLHYGLLLVFPLFAAGVLGARELDRRWPAIPAAAIALPALVVGFFATPFVAPVESPALGRLAACTAQLPTRATVAADDPVAAPLAARPRLTPTALAVPSAYVVVDRMGREPGYVDLRRRAAVVANLPAQGRSLLCDDGRFQLWSPASA
ncbi:MAG: hypothetical protein NVS9B1_08870 [Candidatus Dormibacteraceae bacterium]